MALLQQLHLTFISNTKHERQQAVRSESNYVATRLPVVGWRVFIARVCEWTPKLWRFFDQCITAVALICAMKCESCLSIACEPWNPQVWPFKWRLMNSASLWSWVAQSSRHNTEGCYVRNKEKRNELTLRNPCQTVVKLLVGWLDKTRLLRSTFLRTGSIVFTLHKSVDRMLTGDHWIFLWWCLLYCTKEL